MLLADFQAARGCSAQGVLIKGYSIFTGFFFPVPVSGGVGFLGRFVTCCIVESSRFYHGRLVNLRGNLVVG